MVVDAARQGAGELATQIAALLSERGLGGDDVNLEHRLDNLRRDRSRRAEEAKAMARRWTQTSGGNTGGAELSAGVLLALAYPDRVAKRRGGETASFLLVNGRAGNIDPVSSLAREPYLAVAEMAGSAGASRIVLAAPISEAEIESLFSDEIKQRDEITFDRASESLRARRVRRLRAVTLSEQTLMVTPGPEAAAQLAQGVATLGIGRLPWSKAQFQMRDRVKFLRAAEGEEWPDLSDATLAQTAATWLAPFLTRHTASSQIVVDDLAAALDALLPWHMRHRLDAEAPTHFTAPTGTSVPIDYDHSEGPKISIRVQEMFGLRNHPALANGGLPLIVELLSPAHRLVQVTRDLPGFWQGSYADVRNEMKGRYPKHPWPEDPMGAAPTRRAKPRGIK